MIVATGGRLLDRVAYCMRPTSKATNIIDEPIVVRDTFPYNPESKTAPDTAARWASWCNNDSRRYEPEVIVRDNTPFTITITDLHVRNEGGRAYKVIDTEMRRFDLREDQVLEVMKNVGIMPGGGVAGNFVWGILGSQVRLVLVGGDLHRDMVKGAEEKKAFDHAQKAGLHPQETTFQVGHIYQKRDKTLHLFLGRVRRPGVSKTLFAFLQLPDRPHDWADVDFATWGSNPSAARYEAERETSKRWDSMTWTERCQWTWYDQHEFSQREYPQAAPGYYHHPGPITLMSSPKFEAELGAVPELVLRLRTNEGSEHPYVDGHGKDIAEELWSRANGAQREWHGSRTIPGWYTFTHEQRERALRDHYLTVRKAFIETRAAFQRTLEWL